jgi:UDP-N-acetylmuramoylalanine--D-glutamate ligase
LVPDLKNKKVTVIGAGRSGMAAARLLKALGAQVLVSEKREAQDGECKRLDEMGVSYEFGGNSGKAAVSDLVVVSPGVKLDLPALESAREKGVPVIGEVELAYRCTEARIIGITGTNGKSTTTSMLGSILETAGLEVRVGGNLAPGRPICDLALEVTEKGYIVAEISTFQLESIFEFRPYIGIVTNITPDHLDRHPDFESYARLKARLLENQTASDYAVLNADDPNVKAYCHPARPQRITFSRSQSVSRGAWLDGSDLVISDRGRRVPVMRASELKVPGEHNVDNALAAIAAAMILGVLPEDMASALKSFAGVPHRLEAVAEINGVRYINNSMCTNQAAGVSSLRAFSQPLVVIAGGKEKNVDLSEFLREIAARARAAVLIGENRGRVARELVGLGAKNVLQVVDMKSAVLLAREQARPGDVVILAPGAASFDMFRDFEDRGNQFKQAVLDLREK